MSGVAGSIPYAPPETINDNYKAGYYKTSYDIWSMACIMLEIIQYYRGGSIAVKAFREQRLNETPSPQPRTAQFWKVEAGRELRLKPSVDAVLNWLSKSLIKADTQMGLLLTKMLNVSPGNRPTALECYQELQKMLLVEEVTHNNKYRWKSSMLVCYLNHLPR